MTSWRSLAIALWLVGGCSSTSGGSVEPSSGVTGGGATSGSVSSGTAGSGSSGGAGATGAATGGSAGAAGSAGAGSGAAGSAGAMSGSGTAGATTTGAAGSGDGDAGVSPDANAVSDAGTSDGGDAMVVIGTCSAPTDIYNPIVNLSQTGCVDPNDPTKFTSRAVLYEVNSPLWSDGADKTRAFVLPQGQKIHIDATTGMWVFPVGTVMIKNFIFDGKFVETRLFMNVDSSTWVGYGYAWNGQGTAPQTEATVVGIGRAEVMFNTGQRIVDWYYPSRQDCMDCHNQVAGYTLGPSNGQMYRIPTGQTQNQFTTFQAMGLFDAPPVAPTAAEVLVTPYPGQLGSPPPTATLDQKARSYLAANCAHCHQPNDGFIMSPFPNFDLRYTTALADANICNVMASKGLVPGSNATTILVPGQPMNSVMWVRMNEPPSEDDSTGRMPQIGTHVVDTMGLQLIGDWITSIQTCP
jgi:hypothetical protein